MNRVKRASLAAALLLLPSVLHAQLPAPPVSSEKLLHVGGYAGVVFGTPPAGSSKDVEISQSVVAALLSGTLLPRLTYFAELEAASRSRENWTGDPENDAFDIERLYAEVTIADALRIRGGRFLTPIGQWNEDHADPLTWTPQRPLTTYRPFAKSTTGLLIAGQFSIAGRDAGYALYGSPGSPDGEEEESVFARAVGGRLAMEIVPGLTIGGSFSEFRASRPIVQDDDQEVEIEPEDDSTVVEQPEPEDRVEDVSTRRLFGADIRLDSRYLNLHAEATTVSRTFDRPRENGAFVQAAVPLAFGISAVGRMEYYDPVVSSSLRIGTAGLTYRPTARIAVKVAHQWTSRVSFRVPAGWFVSFSGLL